MKRAILSFTIVLLASPLAHSEMDETRTTLRTHVLKLINRDRQLYSLPPVQLDLAASTIGDEYCRQQIAHNTNGHFTTDGLTPYMRYSFAGGNDGVTENAAAWSATYAFSERALYEMARRSQDAMMGEAPPNDGHKRAILDPHATHVGIGLAWERGEFRLVQEFIRRYVAWKAPLPRRAAIGDAVVAAGRAVNGAEVDAISVHFEKFPETMPSHVANALESYSLPRSRKDYLPRLRQDYTRHPNGTIEMVTREYADGSRGHFYLGQEGDFSFAVPFDEGPGVYTVVVWVKREGTNVTVSASNVSIRVEEASPAPMRASAGGR
ncbi:MAG TPA: CAP domain-containing protein [Thermoanaerobaculia bacterium]|nr:CAP domain-containing protein [Thermoanaerobaculia bacterium]